MDQVRVALVWLKEHHFWVLSAIVSIVAVVCWYLATGSLATEFAKNQAAIKKEFDAQRRLSGLPFHPSVSVNEQEEEEIKQLASKVEQIWTRLYDRQREQVLQWPAQLDANASTKFSTHVASKAFGDFIGNDFRDRYLNYIKNRFPDLAKIIQAREPDDRQMRGRGGGGMMGMEMGGGGAGFIDEEVVEEQDYLVVWEDQLEVKAQLAWTRRPSSLRIWVTQEDLWVYETLLRAIAATNEAAGADRYTNTAVRNIYQFQVGQAAASEPRSGGGIFVPEGEAASSGGGLDFERGGFGDEGGGGFDFERGGSRDEGFGGGPGGGDGDELSTLLANRYIDDEGNPLPAPSSSSGPIKIGSPEYKKLPVRLALKMDQRWLHRLIVELANAPLQVEVDRVRVNPPDAEIGGAGGLGGGARSKKFRALDLASRSGNRAGGGGGGGFGAAMELAVFEREPHIADVILQGAVYIFNPPDAEVLSVDRDEEFVAADF